MAANESESFVLIEKMRQCNLCIAQSFLEDLYKETGADCLCKAEIKQYKNYPADGFISLWIYNECKLDLLKESPAVLRGRLIKKLEETKAFIETDIKKLKKELHNDKKRPNSNNFIGRV